MIANEHCASAAYYRYLRHLLADGRPFYVVLHELVQNKRLVKLFLNSPSNVLLLVTQYMTRLNLPL